MQSFSLNKYSVGKRRNFEIGIISNDMMNYFVAGVADSFESATQVICRYLLIKRGFCIANTECTVRTILGKLLAGRMCNPYYILYLIVNFKTSRRKK